MLLVALPETNNQIQLIGTVICWSIYHAVKIFKSRKVVACQNHILQRRLDGDTIAVKGLLQ